MVTQTSDPDHFNQKAQQIRAHVPTALTQHGLLPKFTSWRLTQDPSTGLVVLFGILNDKYIAEHTQTPFGAYFDPRLLHDLATDLQVQVVPSDTEGLRYAFILDWGQLGQHTAPIDFSGLQPEHLLAEETDSHKPIILVWDEHLVVARPISPTFAGSVVVGLSHTRADDFPSLLEQTVNEAEVPPPAPLFAPPLGYQKTSNDYNLTPPGPGGGFETLPRPLLPRPLWAPENYNDLLMTLGRSAEEFVQAAANLAGIGRQWTISVLISAPE